MSDQASGTSVRPGLVAASVVWTVRILLYVFIVSPLMLASAVVGASIYFVGRLISVPWLVWLTASPLVYSVWFLMVLTFAGFLSGFVGRKSVKPKYVATYPGRPADPAQTSGLVTIVFCYAEAAIISSLPLFRAASQSQLLSSLLLRSYSPSVHIGSRLVNWGDIYDPDLTEIGDNVIVGSNASVVAHGMSTRQDGAVVFVCAPITIGNRVTIGGSAHVTLGCAIGDDAIIEAGSVLTPFTRIPAGEVWGGNPAQFQRKRDGSGASPDGYGTARIVATASSPNGVRDQSPQVPKSPDPAGEFDEVRNLVIGALGLKSENVPTELSADTCPDWDSLGQIAIASAIFDRYGVALDEGTLYRLRTLGDVAYAAAGGPFGTTVDVQTPHETFSETEPVEPVAVSAVGSLPEDFEMLPLLDPQEATRLLAERFQDATESDDLTPIRVVVAATFTAQPVATSLRLWGRASGFDIDCHFADYNQIVRTLLDDSSPFCANRDGVNVILARPEDVVADSEEKTSSYVDQIFQAATHFECSGPKSGQLLIGTLPPVVSSFSTLDREMARENAPRLARAH